MLQSLHTNGWYPVVSPVKKRHGGTAYRYWEEIESANLGVHAQ